MAKEPRVVITGLGVVAPNGIGKEAYWEALTTGRSGVDYIKAFDASEMDCQIAAEVRGFEPKSYMSVKETRRLGRASQFAIAASQMALADAKFQVTPENSRHLGVCYAAGIGKAEAFEKDYQAFADRGGREANPSTLFEVSPHAVSSHVAMAVGSTGVCGTLAMGCTSGLDVLKWAFMQIRQRQAHLMVVGSAEAMITRFAMSVVAANGVLAKRHDAPQTVSRPFERDRNGLVLGEGSGALIVES